MPADQVRVVEGDGFSRAAARLQRLLDGVPGLRLPRRHGRGRRLRGRPGNTGLDRVALRVRATPHGRDLGPAPPLGLAVEDVALDQVHHTGRDRRIGARLKQRDHRAGAPQRRREHQRCLPPLGLPHIHVGPPAHQRRHGLHVTRSRREMKRRGPRPRHGPHIGTRLHQHRHDRAVPRPPRHMQRPVRTQARRRLKVGPHPDQHLRDLHVPVQRRPVQPRHPVPPGRVHIGPLRDQRPHGVGIVAHRGVGHRRVGRIRSRRLAGDGQAGLTRNRHTPLTRGNRDRFTGESVKTVGTHVGRPPGGRRDPHHPHQNRAQPTHHPPHHPAHPDSPNALVLFPKLATSSIPSLCMRLSMTFAIGVPGSARRWRLPSRRPFAPPTTKSGQRL